VLSTVNAAREDVLQKTSTGFKNDQLLKNVQQAITVTYDMIGYVGHTTEYYCSQITSLWARRGLVMKNKEECSIFATFGAGGQGKTELCRELVRHLPSALQKSCDTILACVCILISFNQETVWTSQENSDPSFKPIWKRFCMEMNIDMDNSWQPTSMENMIDFFREAAANAYNVELRQTCVCLLLDEIINVFENNRREILNHLSAIQQSGLIHSFPTFFLTTSLKVEPVHQILTTESKRPLIPIPLPILEETKTREYVTNQIVDAIFSFWDGVLLASEEKKIRGKGDLRRLVQRSVYHVGNHFRALEEFIKAAFQNLVPSSFSRSSKYVKYLQQAFLMGENECRSNLEEPYKLELVTPPSASDADEIIACDIFSDHLLLGDGEYWVREQGDIARLLSYHIVFVRKRSTQDVFNFSPLISLPLLFRAWRNMRNQNLLYSTLARIADLVMPTNMQEASTYFEEVILQLMLARLLIHAKKEISQPVRVPLKKLLPNAIIVPWDNQNDNLIVEVDQLSLMTTPFLQGVDNGTPDQALRALLEPLPANCLFRMQGRVPAKGIEEVGPMVMESEHSKRMLIWSMKLRQHNCKETATSVARNLHKLLQQEKKDKQYYAVVVTCQKADSIKGLCPGSIAVPSETLQVILEPFGASYMLDIIHSKTNKS